jgi:3-phenylpropionate/cinnamic acid dioxygenase small subunit
VQAEDLRQVLALLADYSRLLDEGKLDEFLELWTKDCRLHVFGTDYVGREAIGRFLVAAPRGKHVTGVPNVQFDGATARSRSDYLFFREDLRLFNAGIYEDEFVREAARWRFARRKVASQLRAA